MKAQHKILLTGAHAATTALAFIEEINADRSTNWEVMWVGPKESLSHKGVSSFEMKLFPTLGVKVYSITAGKIQSKFTRYTIPTLLRLPVGFFQAFSLIFKLKPEIVVAFGGYASVPIVVAAWCLGIPIIVQEQISGGGLANKISSRFAKVVAVSREASLAVFPRNKTIVIGHPLEKRIQEMGPKKRLSSMPTVLVMGGSRGAQRINNLIFTMLDDLLTKYRVIHLVGKLDYEKAQAFKSLLDNNLSKKYTVYDFVSPLEIYMLYQKADIFIGRSGANTVSEVTYLALPAIYIPIPWSIGDEQRKNADEVVNIGAAILLSEAEMTKDRILQLLSNVVKNWSYMNNSAKKAFNYNSHATLKLLNIVKQHLK